MSKVSYTTLDLKLNTEVKTIIVNGIEIEVKQYLPISDKYDLIMITIQQSYENGIYNSLKQDMFFDLNLVFLYTNLSFTDEQKDDLSKLYDVLNSNGVIDAIVKAIPQEEYESLLEYTEKVTNDFIFYNNSAAGTIQGISEIIINNIDKIMDMVQNFDKEKFKDAVSFARAIGADV